MSTKVKQAHGGGNRREALSSATHRRPRPLTLLRGDPKGWHDIVVPRRKRVGGHFGLPLDSWTRQPAGLRLPEGECFMSTNGKQTH